MNAKKSTKTAYRVLMVTGIYPTEERPHAGTFIASQVDSLVEAGLEVEIIHPKPGPVLLHRCSLHRHTRYLEFERMVCPVVVKRGGRQLSLVPRQDAVLHIVGQGSALHRSRRRTTSTATFSRQSFATFD